MISKFIILSILLLSSAAQQDVYWRRFTGVIPDDALVGAINSGNSVFIGRAPRQSQGLLIGPILAGNNYITVAFNSNAEILKDKIEILCTTHPENFSWTLTTAESLLSNSGLVKGGYYVDQNMGTFYIGRTALTAGDYTIGRVDGFHTGDSQNDNKLFIVEENRATERSDYEVLVYNDID